MQKKKGTLPFFNYNKDGKGVSKEEAKLPFNFICFFKYFKRHFSKMLSVNIAMILGNFPIFFILPVLAGYFHTKSITPTDQIYSLLGGTLPFLEDASALTPALSTVGLFESISAWTLADRIIMGLSLLALLTFGPVNVGTTYILRNILKGEPVYMWEDMKYSIKRNLRQCLIYGIFDIVLSFMLVYDVWFFFINAGLGLGYSIGFYTSLVALVFYFFMRFYIYLMMVTFDLSLFKIFKNAMIFAFLGFKRNILALLGILAVLFLNFIFFLTPITMALGIALPFVMTLGICTYISTYAAWPKIKEIMINPYYKEEEIDYSAEAIMKDII